MCLHEYMTGCIYWRLGSEGFNSTRNVYS